MKKIIFTLIPLLIIIYFSFHEKRFNNQTIFIGSSLPKTSVLRKYGKSVQNGAQTYFDFVNQNRVLKNHKIKFLTYDDKYEPKLTLKNTQELVRNKDLFVLFGFVGTSTVKNILPLINEYNIPLVATFSGASFLRRDLGNDNIVNIRSSYDDEIKAHIKYLYEQKGFRKIAVFYQNDSYGEDGYVSVINILKKYKLSPIAEGNYKRNTLSISHAFNSIKDANPEAIIMIGENKANTLFIKKAQQNKNFNNTVFSNISFGDASEMIKNLEKNSKNIIFSQVVPSYQNQSIPVVKEYLDISKQYNPNFEPNFVSLEAFLSAKIFVAAIKKIKGDITREKFKQAIRNLPQNTLSGISLDNEGKNLLNKVYLFQYQNKKFVEIQK